MSKEARQLNIWLEPELFKFLAEYAEENYKTITGALRHIIFELYKAKKERLVVDADGNNVTIKK